jgi:hypothetical protein
VRSGPSRRRAAKPGLVFNVDQLTERARKLAAHNRLSWEKDLRIRSISIPLLQ